MATDRYKVKISRAGEDMLKIFSVKTIVKIFLLEAIVKIFSVEAMVKIFSVEAIVGNSLCGGHSTNSSWMPLCRFDVVAIGKICSWRL